MNDAEVSRRAQEILDTLTLSQKIALGSGSDFWHTKALDEAGVPALKMSDGPSGLRCQPDAGDMLGLNESLPAVCFPAAVTTACTFDPELVERVGQAIGEETLAQGVGVVLGPGANIKRSPLCGRSFEYFSEDPLLAGELAAAWIRGVEATGAGASSILPVTIKIICGLCPIAYWTSARSAKSISRRSSAR